MQLITCGAELFYSAARKILKSRCFPIAHSGLVCFRCTCSPGNGFPHLQPAGGAGVCTNLRLPHHLQGRVRGRRSRHEGRQRVRGELILMRENSVSLNKQERRGNCHFFLEGKVSTCPELAMCCASNLSRPSSSLSPHGGNTDVLSHRQPDGTLMGRRKGWKQGVPHTGLNLCTRWSSDAFDWNFCFWVLGWFYLRR